MNINIFPNELLPLSQNDQQQKLSFFMTSIHIETTDVSTFLTHFELSQYSTYSLEKRRAEWLAGRYCLKQCFAQFTQQEKSLNDLHQFEVRNREDGRPFVVNHSEDVSISHSKHYAVAMVSNSPCGIDIQQVVPTLEKVKDRYCSTSEFQILQKTSGKESLHQLAMLWASKESIQKMLTAQENMPGFLELMLIDVKNNSESFIFSLSYTKNTCTRTFNVFVTTFENYAVAYTLLEDTLCLNSQK